ncbi:MAG: efflux RND transporter periplasmic adaptor subunit [Candidatus Binatia bacterium]|nr:efflux RND transporter periplasmic adaptor subunit [Candidatus Binatia bacterium]
MKRYLWLCIPLAVALVWLGGGARLVTVLYDALQDWLGGGAVVVRAAQVKKSAIAIIVRGSGELEPVKMADIPSPLAGTVGQVHVKIGDAVKGGQLLATVRAGEIIERLEKSEQALRLGEAALKKSAEQHAAALNRLEKTRELLAKDSIARKDLSAHESGAAAASAERDLAQAQISQQEAEQAQLRRLLALANIFAPFAGVVTRRWVEPGGKVKSSAPVLTIGDPGRLKIVIKIPAKYLAAIHEGLAAQVDIKDFPGRVLLGHMVNAYRDTTTGGDGALAEIHLVNTEFEWTPGSQALVTLRLDERHDALLVPQQALVEREGRTFVYAIVDGKARRRPVVAGESQDEMVEMTSGVAEGEWIVVAAPRTMAEGLRVRALENGGERR